MTAGDADASAEARCYRIYAGRNAPFDRGVGHLDVEAREHRVEAELEAVYEEHLGANCEDLGMK